MANIINTTIEITHQNHDKIKNFGAKLKNWTGKNFLENSYDDEYNWLGNIIGFSGIGKYDEENKEFYCEVEGKRYFLPSRGEVNHIEVFGNTITIQITTAWSPMLIIWKKLVDKHLPEADVDYVISGEEIYQTSKENYKDSYFIDIWEEFNDLFPCYKTISAKHLNALLEELLDERDTELKDLINDFESSSFSNYMTIHEWKVTPFSEAV